MALGTALLEQVFKVFVEESAKKNTFVRLYRETGNAGKKAYGNCSKDIKVQMVDIITPSDIHTKNHPSIRTTVMVLDELAHMEKLELLAKTYRSLTGTAEKGFKCCKPKTQKRILKLGLHK